MIGSTVHFSILFSSSASGETRRAEGEGEGVLQKLSEEAGRGQACTLPFASFVGTEGIRLVARMLSFVLDLLDDVEILSQ